MRIAISAEANQGLDSPISQHFGRCPYFILVDLKEQEIEAVTGRKIFLQLRVKVLPGWRNDEQALKQFGFRTSGDHDG